MNTEMHIVNHDLERHPFTDDSSDTYGCIIMDYKKHVLLVKGSSKYSLPKGSRKRAETPEECAIREVWEETGLDLSNVNLGLPKKLSRGRYYFIRLKQSFETYKFRPQPKEKGTVCWIHVSKLRDLNPEDCNVDMRLCIEKPNIITNRLVNKNG